MGVNEKTMNQLKAHDAVIMKNLFESLYLQMHMYLLAQVNLYEVVLTSKFACQDIHANFNVKIGADLHNFITFRGIQFPSPG